MNTLCGIRLSTVGMVVGWLNLIGAIFSTVILSAAFVYLDDIVKAVEDKANDPAKETSIRTAVIIALCVYYTTSVANVIASSLLIVGTIKERHLLLAPWLINAYILVFFNVLNFIYMVYIMFAQAVPLASALPTVVVTALSLVIQIVIWNAIYSLFKQIRANRDMQQRLLPTTTASQLPNYTSPTNQANNYTKMYPSVE